MTQVSELMNAWHSYSEEQLKARKPVEDHRNQLSLDAFAARNDRNAKAAILRKIELVDKELAAIDSEFNRLRDLIITKILSEEVASGVVKALKQATGETQKTLKDLNNVVEKLKDIEKIAKIGTKVLKVVLDIVR